jgi:hypothetical protein
MALLREARTGFRRMRRAERATGRSPLPGGNPFHVGGAGLARLGHEKGGDLIFTQKLLVPGPGNKPRATFRCRPFQSALRGSLFFIFPALPEVFDLKKFVSPIWFPQRNPNFAHDNINSPAG